THLRLAETARGYSWAAQANAARVERRVYIERDSVLVDGDAPAIQCGFGFFSADPLRKHIKQHHVSVGAARDNEVTRINHPPCQSTSVRDNLFLVGDEFRLHSLQKADRFGSDHM